MDEIPQAALAPSGRLLRDGLAGLGSVSAAGAAEVAPAASGTAAQAEGQGLSCLLMANQEQLWEQDSLAGADLGLPRGALLALLPRGRRAALAVLQEGARAPSLGLTLSVCRHDLGFPPCLATVAGGSAGALVPRGATLGASHFRESGSKVQGGWARETWRALEESQATFLRTLKSVQGFLVLISPIFALCTA